MSDALPPIIELPSLKQPEAWNEPVLFGELETPPIQADWLPGVLGQFAAAMAESTETLEALSVMTVLGVISVAAAKRFIVCPTEGWQEPVNIYTLIALPPANHKSLVLKHATHPLMDWEKQQRMQLEPEIKRQASERKTQEKIIDGLRANAAKVKNPQEQQALIQAISAKETTLPVIPVAPELFTSDATPESLAALVHEQGGRFAIFSDEGGILETLAGLYNNGAANVDILLKGIDGGEVRIRRKDRSVALNPFLTIVLTVQPAVIQSMGEKRAYLGNGALERFLYVLPKSNLGYRTHNKSPISTELYAAYHRSIYQLLEECASCKAEDVYQLTLQPSAYHAWRDFQLTTEAELRPEGKLANCQGWGGKISGFALRIAGLLHIAEYGSGSLMILESTIRNALAIAMALKEHALAAFGLMGVDQATEDAQVIFHWIMSANKHQFTQSELLLAMRNRRLGKAERLAKALQILQERYIVSEPKKLMTRKPTVVYMINPRIFRVEG